MHTLPVVDGAPPPIPGTETGQARFERLTHSQQRELLGPGKHDAYLDGRLRLRDVVATEQNPRWGQIRRERTLGDILRRATRRRPPQQPTYESMKEAFPVEDGIGRAQGIAARKGIAQMTRVGMTPPTGFPACPIGSLPRVTDDLARANAYYHPAHHIKINEAMDRASPDIASTVVHEIGHAIDFRGRGVSRAASAGDGPWAGFRTVANGSDAIRVLKSVRESLIRELRTLRSASRPNLGAIARAQLQRRWIHYAVGPDEVWARALQQYVAEKRSPQRHEYLPSSRTERITPWWEDPADWEPIKSAVEVVLRSEGWIT